MTDNIAHEVQDLELDSTEAFILLYQLEWVPATGNTAAVYLNFHSQDTDETVVFDGETYEGMPIQIEGIEKHADGAAARPQLIIPNIETIFRSNHPLKSQLVAAGVPDFEINDLLGKRLIHRKTLRKYVKLGSETTPTNSFQFPKSEYIIDRVASKTPVSITLELASPFELNGVVLPNRIVTGKYCPWVYKGWRLDKTDVKSACHWDSKMRDHEGDRPFVFFTIDDEPLIIRSSLPSNAGTIAWSDQRSYDGNNIVYYAPDGVFYQSMTFGNENNTPVEKSTHWRIVRTYEIWSNTLVATTPAGDARKATYAFKNGEVYKAVKPSGHPSDTSQAKDPETNPAFWVRADVCGKLLSSCKARYQVDLRAPFTQINPTTNATEVTGLITAGGVKHAIPTVFFNNQISLPFGGFPGTRSFR